MIRFLVASPHFLGPLIINIKLVMKKHSFSESKISKMATTHQFKFLESKIKTKMLFSMALLVVLPLVLDMTSLFMTIATQTLVPVPALAIATSHQLVSLKALNRLKLFSLAATLSKSKTSKFIKSNSEEKK